MQQEADQENGTIRSVFFDQFVRGIHDSGIINDIEFERFYRKNCEIEIVKYRGVYAIVDNCYLH